MLSVRKALTRLLAQVLPPACPLCSRTFPADWSEPFCSDCLAGFLPLPVVRCSRCALPFKSTEGSSHLCGGCLKAPPPFSNVYALGRYEGTLRDAIHQFKFNGRVSLDRPLAKLLFSQIAADAEFDIVIPVPLSHKRLQQRNYNQALLLARDLARCYGLSVAEDLLRKHKDTVAQHDLPAIERQRNLQGVFRTSKSLQGETILLVDDVMTTGSTVSACSQELLACGASEVQVAVLGRA